MVQQFKVGPVQIASAEAIFLQSFKSKESNFFNRSFHKKLANEADILNLSGCHLADVNFAKLTCHI